MFDLEFEEEGGKEEGDELVGKGKEEGEEEEEGGVHSMLWEKLGMTPVATPSPPPKENGGDAEKEMNASQKLVELAFHQGLSYDNISVIVVNFAEM